MFKYFIAFFVFLYFFCDVKTSYSQNTKDTLLKQNEHFSNAGYFSVENSPRKTLNFNIGWRFFKGSVEGAYKEDFDDNSWEGVNLPHGLEILGDNASGGRNYQGEAWYRKKFKISDSARNARLFIYFEGIMGKSKVWINGKEIVSHYGGYLPFAADITDVVRRGNNDNTIAVLADNSDDTSYPPGKQQSGLDFSYFGGIYRDVYLISTPSVYITLPQLSKTVASGGVFAATLSAKGNKADIAVKTEICNSEAEPKRTKLVTTIEDTDGNTLEQVSQSKVIKPAETYSFNQRINVSGIKLWHPNNPNLNFIKTEVWVDGIMVDAIKTRFGVRSVKMNGPKGLYINGEPFNEKLIGANRHQDYVYVGNALPNSGQWRDVKKLREAGCNIIRVAHYPMDDAFYDACDEFGVLTTSANPGWHFFNFKNELFEKRLYEDTRNLVRKNRNHCSIIMWETALNETPQQPGNVMHNMHLAAHEEYPYPGFYTVTDIQEAKKGGFDIYYHGDDENVNSFIRECGDGNEVDNWYSQNAVTRVKRAWGEKALLDQAENISKTFSNLYGLPPVKLGGALWAGIEHYRGYHPDPFLGGLMDVYRIPKYSYYLLKSQISPDMKIKNIETGPMVRIMNELTQLSSEDIYVYSNCDEVRLSVNGKVVGVQKPEKTYGDLPHPPFIFRNAFNFMSLKGIGRNRAFNYEVKVEGIIDGQVVAEHAKLYPLRSLALKLEVDDENMELVADGSDFVPIRAYVVDDNGTVKVLSSEEIYFEIEGPGSIINPMPVKSEFGVVTALVRSDIVSGEIKVKAYSNGLKGAEIILHSRPMKTAAVYNKEYLNLSKKNVKMNVVNIDSGNTSQNTDAKKYKDEIKHLHQQIVGYEQELMELRSKVKE